jgi:hypothetical protein
MPQIVGRYYEPRKKKSEPKETVWDLGVAYDRPSVRISDLLRVNRPCGLSTR